MGIEKQGSRLSDIHELENKVMTIEKQYKKQYEILETYQGLPPVNKI
jgi:penicillin V acylase-like amidase (Ntn superfamily)